MPESFEPNPNDHSPNREGRPDIEAVTEQTKEDFRKAVIHLARQPVEGVVVNSHGEDWKTYTINEYTSILVGSDYSSQAQGEDGEQDEFFMSTFEDQGTPRGDVTIQVGYTLHHDGRFLKKVGMSGAGLGPDQSGRTSEERLLDILKTDPLEEKAQEVSESEAQQVLKQLEQLKGRTPKRA